MLVRTMFDRADQRGLRSVEVMGSTITLPVERKFGSVESVQAYCDQLLGLNWVRETWTRATIPVSVRSPRRQCRRSLLERRHRRPGRP